ncbi:hypothetical protein EDD27_5686 [Nonomuraea polychroma]|uniref:Uncharacterized protein n=2 Tax=Nonomuraea polychroma TaxID=46176 RepID=A0A438MBA7_9ACTN|nr:hypothetical protein EDD27_5686 [Nonomuraea polychroma]
MTCPRWCIEGHNDGERRHLAEIRDVCVTADGTGAHIPQLYFDLRQGPDDDQPMIHIEIDERPVARLTVGEAVKAGLSLIGLAGQVIGQ